MAKTTHRRTHAQRRRSDPVAGACKALAGCAAALLASTVAAFFIVWNVSGTAADPTVGPVVVESGYDATQNTIDQTQYASTILQQTEDAGQQYIDETLFLGDSNTARMYRMFDYCTYDNAIGSVGMSARSLQSYACVLFSGYGSYVTMPQAVALMQPKRVIVTFGTNDLDPNYSADSFAENYCAGLQAIADAYPSVDIIVNAIPPLGRSHSNANLTQSQVDAYNKAIVQMCEDNGWKFLNSAEVLKDASTGYAKAGYVEESDGIHLTRAAMEELFTYIRTHSYVTPDDRPALTAVPRHVDDKDAVTYTAPVVDDITDTEPDTAPTETPEPEATPTPMPEETPAPAEPTPTPEDSTPAESVPDSTPETPQEPESQPESTAQDAPAADAADTADQQAEQTEPAAGE